MKKLNKDEEEILKDLTRILLKISFMDARILNKMIQENLVEFVPTISAVVVEKISYAIEELTGQHGMTDFVKNNPGVSNQQISEKIQEIDGQKENVPFLKDLANNTFETLDNSFESLLESISIEGDKKKKMD